MKLRFALLTIMVCALTMFGFKAYTHFAMNPPITDIAGTRSVTHQNTGDRPRPKGRGFRKVMRKHLWISEVSDWWLQQRCLQSCRAKR